MKISIFWDITPCSPFKVNRRFGRTYHLYFQDRKINTWFHVGFLLCLFFDPEYGGDIFLRNLGWLSTDYTALYPRRQNPSNVILFAALRLQMKWARSQWSGNHLFNINLVVSLIPVYSYIQCFYKNLYVCPASTMQQNVLHVRICPISLSCFHHFLYVLLF
jgi:hypothetical protein